MLGEFVTGTSEDLVLVLVTALIQRHYVDFEMRQRDALVALRLGNHFVGGEPRIGGILIWSVARAGAVAAEAEECPVVGQGFPYSAKEAALSRARCSVRH